MNCANHKRTRRLKKRPIFMQFRLTLGEAYGHKISQELVYAPFSKNKQFTHLDLSQAAGIVLIDQCLVVEDPFPGHEPDPSVGADLTRVITTERQSQQE